VYICSKGGITIAEVYYRNTFNYLNIPIYSSRGKQHIHIQPQHLSNKNTINLKSLTYSTCRHMYLLTKHQGRNLKKLVVIKVEIAFY